MTTLEAKRLAIRALRKENGPDHVFKEDTLNLILGDIDHQDMLALLEQPNDPELEAENCRLRADVEQLEHDIARLKRIEAA